MVQSLENEADISEVTSFVKAENGVVIILVENFDRASEGQVNAITDDSCFDYWLIVLHIFVGERRADHCNQLTIGLISELWVKKENLKLLLMLMDQVVFHNLHLHVF